MKTMFVVTKESNLGKQSANSNAMGKKMYLQPCYNLTAPQKGFSPLDYSLFYFSYFYLFSSPWDAR